MDNVGNKRTSIFISHATPDDNGFAIWLAMRLKACGYSVWCDVFNLMKGGDFWKKIEQQIRERTCKFLPVMTKISNAREGVMQEIAVAKSVGKNLHDNDFIIPIRVDSDLSFGDFDPRLITCNGVDFTTSWAEGFTELVKNLNDMKCPKSGDITDSTTIYERMILEKYSVVVREEVFDSNWFSLSNLPHYVYFYPFKCSVKVTESDSIGLQYKNHFVSFIDRDMMPSEIRQLIVADVPPIKFNLKDFLKENKDCEFIKCGTFKWLVVGLLAKVFNQSLRNQFGVSVKNMSNRQIAFFYKTGVLEKDKKDRITLVGKYKNLRWHFAISGNIKLFPAPMLQLKTHVLFSKDGFDINLEDRVSHAARRAIGKRWWNKEWHSKLMAFVSTLVNSPDGVILLKEGVQLPLRLNAKPIQFKAKVTYDEPRSEDNLDDIVIDEQEVELVTTELDEDD